MKKAFSVLSVILLILALLTSCLGKKTDGKGFVMPVSATPESLDPQIASSDVERLVCANCFEGLVRISKSGGIENGVAENYSVSSDGLTYTFTLRENAKWHSLSGYDKFLGDGFEKTFDFGLTADDFVFAFRRALDPATASPDAVSLYAIRNAESINSGAASPDTLGARSLGRHTLEITLEYPDSSFLYTLTKTVAMPCNEAFWTATQGKYGLSTTYTVCNGPFYVSSWNDDESIRISRNDDYTGQNAVIPAYVRFVVNNNNADITEKILNNTYDAAFFTENQLNNADTSKIVSTPFENTVCSLIFNCSDSLFSNVNLRRAVCLAAQIDKSSFPVGISSLASGIVPPYCTYKSDLYRVQAGKAQMTEQNGQDASNCFNAALAELQTDSIRFTILCTDEYEQAVRLLIQSLQKTLGIKLVASVEVVENASLLARVQGSSFNVAFYPLSASEQDAKSYLSSFSSHSGKNLLNFSDANYDLLLASAVSSGNVADLLRCENYLLSNAVIFPVFNQNSYFVTGANTKNIYFYSNEYNVFFISAEKED
jgi:ABC-type oligopeptide transport system substrate-binding subunit